MKTKYSKEFEKSVRKLSGKTQNAVRNTILEVKKASSLDEITDCKKENSLKSSISGTTWWNEQSASYGTTHVEFSFTGSAFYAVMTHPFTPDYPPSRTVGSYTYEYPNIYLECPDFHDVAVMDSDFQSFKLGSDVFIRK